MPIAPLGKVLLVDDDDKLTFIVAAHLRAHGYEVRESNNGQDGVQLACVLPSRRHRDGPCACR